VRLRKGFVNLERAPFGGQKLRIPSLLFMEKMRTQSRFNVRFLLVLIDGESEHAGIRRACIKTGARSGSSCV